MKEISLFRGIIHALPLISQKVAHHLMHGGKEMEVEYSKVFPEIWEAIKNEEIIKEKKDEYENWKREITDMLSYNNWQKAISLFNHFGIVHHPPKRYTSVIKENLCHRLDEDYRNEFAITSDNAFFKVLVVDDFFVIHLAEMFAPAERVMARNREEANPLIHFEFDCIPERAKERINKGAEYNLILLDIDFGNMDMARGSQGTGSQALGVIDTAAKRGIPVVIFSKFREAERYKEFMSNVIGLITKEKLKEKSQPGKYLFSEIFKLLREYYGVEIFLQRKKRKNWLIIKSSKLKRVGGYVTSLAPQKIVDLVGEVKTTIISSKNLKMLGEEKIYRDYLMIPVVGDKENLVLKFSGKIPEFVEKSKYLKPVKERLDIYDIEHNGEIPSFKEIDRGVNYETFMIKTKEKIEGDSFQYNEVDFLLKLERDLEYIVIPSFSKMSLFDIIGPVMIGPSSSHTAGANRLARLARNFAESFPDIRAVAVQMHDSFRSTGEGHGSHKAIAAGLMGYDQKDKRLPESIEVLEKNDWKIKLSENRNLYFCNYFWQDIPNGKYHPNTIKFHLYTEIPKDCPEEKKDKIGDKEELEISRADFSITCRSWGGGNVQISAIAIGKETISFSEEELNENKIKWSGKFPIYIILDSNVNQETVKEALKTTLEERYSGLTGEQFESETARTFHFKPASSFAIFQWDKKDDELIKKFEGMLKFRFCKIESIIPWDEKPKQNYFLNKKDIPPRPDFLTLDDLMESHSYLWEIAIQYEEATQGVNKKYIRRKMKGIVELMEKATKEGINRESKSYTDYTHTLAYSLFREIKAQGTGNKLTLKAGAYAVGVNEMNAKMACPIVAAPTAGSCGIIPGVMVALKEELEAQKLIQKEIITKLTNGLLTASLIGLVINNIVPTAGAWGGCQAEDGTATAMASALITQVKGGSPQQIINAAALALKNSLGLICDPVKGKVEIPCIKRAGMKAGEAIQSAEMALSDVKSGIAPSEIVRTMNKVGRDMKRIYKETSEGGLAITPSAQIC